MASVDRNYMNYSRYTIASSAIFLTLFGLSAQAEPATSCQELVQECLVSASEHRDSCLQTVAAHSLCTASPLGVLVAKRAQFTGIQLPSDEQGPAFLGPQIINRRCVDNFDTAWSAALVKGPLSQDTINRLSRSLEECSTAEDTTLPRP
jgi:hypothetical protein